MLRSADTVMSVSVMPAVVVREAPLRAIERRSLDRRSADDGNRIGQPNFLARAGTEVHRRARRFRLQQSELGIPSRSDVVGQAVDRKIIPESSEISERRKSGERRTVS